MEGYNATSYQGSNKRLLDFSRLIIYHLLYCRNPSFMPTGTIFA
jgi:hypothetical protein